MLRSAAYTTAKGVHATCQRKSLPTLTEAQLRALFKLFDSNGDGRLSKKELKAAFATLGSHLPCWQAMRGLHKADDNHDGFVNVSDDELDHLVKYAVQIGYIITI